MDLKQWVPSGPLGRAKVGGRVKTPPRQSSGGYSEGPPQAVLGRGQGEYSEYAPRQSSEGDWWGVVKTP